MNHVSFFVTLKNWYQTLLNFLAVANYLMFIRDELIERDMAPYSQRYLSQNFLFSIYMYCSTQDTYNHAFKKKIQLVF